MAIQPDMIGFTCHDVQASLAFYRLLGLEIPEVPVGEPYTEVITPNGYRISWNDLEMVKGIDPHWTQPVGHRLGFAFKTDSPAEVDEVYSRIVAAGHKGHLAPWDAFWGQRYAVVVDPDGNLIDIFCPLVSK